MIRQIIIPKERTYTLEMPESFVGKRIELLAFEVEEEEIPISETVNDKNEKLKRLNDSLLGYRVDLGNFTFDRDQANEYE